MPSGPRLLLDHACYHIIARGNQKQLVFHEDKDYQGYLERLRKYKKKYDFFLYAFCLMPNHIHILGEIKKISDLSRFMASLQRSYTAYFNKKYGKVGHLWQERFISKAIIKDKYLIDCISYIELNPLRANIASNMQEYNWSSYMERALEEYGQETLLNNLKL